MTYFQYETPIQQVGTTRNKFADSFAGTTFAGGTASINALTDRGWRIVRNTGGMIATLNNGNLTLGMGTTNGAEFLMVGPQRQTLPATLTAVLQMSQRIAGNEVRVGYVAVHPDTGLPVAHATLTGFFANFTAMRFSGTNASEAFLEAMADNAATVASVSNGGMSSTASPADFSIEARNEDVILVSSTADSTATRGNGALRLSSLVPNVDLAYVPFVWCRNVSAPASNTNVTLRRILALDIQELQAEIGGGRGNITGAQAIPVVLAAAGNSVQGVSIQSVRANADPNGLTIHRLLSAATTNATVVKASSGRLYAGLVTNSSASWRWLKFYNRTTAPTVGTDVPVLTFGLPPNGSLNLANVLDMYGVQLGTGIAYAITAGVADNDTVAVGANEVVVNLLFS